MAIDPRQARTDLFGEGTGESVVLSNRDFMAREQRAAQERKVAGAAKTAKAAAKKLADTKVRERLIKTAGTAKVFGMKPADEAKFEKMGTEYRKAVLNAIGSDRVPSVQDEVKLKMMYNDMIGEGKVAIEHKKAMAKQLETADPDLHYLADIEALEKGYATEGGYGQTYALPDRIDYEGDYFKTLLSEANARLGHKEFGRKEITLGEAQEMIATQMLGDRALMDGTKKEMMEEADVTAKNWQDISDDEAVTYRLPQATRLADKVAGFVPDRIAKGRAAAASRKLVRHTTEEPLQFNIETKGAGDSTVRGTVTTPIAASGLSKTMKSALPPTAQAIDMDGNALDLLNFDISDATIVGAAAFPRFKEGDKLGSLVTDKEAKEAGTEDVSKYEAMAMLQVKEEYQEETGEFDEDDKPIMKTKTRTRKVLVPLYQIRNSFHKDDIGMIDDLIAETKTLNAERKPAKAKMMTEERVTITANDQAALKWAEANPNDPRAKKIKQRLKVN